MPNNAEKDKAAAIAACTEDYLNLRREYLTNPDGISEERLHETLSARALRFGISENDVAGILQRVDAAGNKSGMKQLDPDIQSSDLE